MALCPNIDAHSDNMVFVEKYRSNQKRPPLPDPKFHPDDEDDGIVSQSLDDENSEQSAEVLYWSEKWRLVIGKILQRDIEMISPKITAKDSKDKQPPAANLDNDSKDQPPPAELLPNGGSSSAGGGWSLLS